MSGWFLQLSPVVQAAIVAAVVGLLSSNGALLLKHWLDNRSLRKRLEAESEYEQRRRLKAAIGKHLGSILEHAERLDHRLWNLQANHDKGWLCVESRYTNPPYYFRSTAYRFLSFFTAVRAFFDDAIYIDPRYASGEDLNFLRQLKAMEWSVTDVTLFDGLVYDPFHELDHLFRGTLHGACESLVAADGLVTESEFGTILASDLPADAPIRSVLEFFDGLRANEDRFRWDRLVVLHLLLMGFMASFGYDMQRPSLEQFREIARTIRNPSVAQNLADWLPKLGVTRHPSGLTIRLALAQEKPNVPGIGVMQELQVDKFLEGK